MVITKEKGTIGNFLIILAKFEENLDNAAKRLNAIRAEKGLAKILSESKIKKLKSGLEANWKIILLQFIEFYGSKKKFPKQIKNKVKEIELKLKQF